MSLILLKKLIKHRRILVLKNKIFGLKISIFSFLGFFIVMGIVYQFITYKKEFKLVMTYDLDEGLLENYDHNYMLLEKGQGCRMPIFNPFDKYILAMEKNLPAVVCEKKDWITCDKSTCYVDNQLHTYKSYINCSYHDIYLDKALNITEDDVGVIRYDDNYTLVKSDHVKVSCTTNYTMIDTLYELSWSGYKGGLRKVRIAESPPGREDNFNIMLLAFGGASRNAFMRHMKNAYKYLVEDLEAVVLNSYNVVGEGVSSTLIPILTGRTNLELLESNEQSAHKFDKDTLNPEDFIFHFIEKDGYRTAFFEDMPWMGTFQTFKKGFIYQPTHHYLHPLLLAESGFGLKWHNEKKKYCFGDMPQYSWMLDITKQFFEEQGKGFSLTVISDITHEHFERIRTAEPDLISFLKHHKSKGTFNNTLLMIMGSNGARLTKAQKLFQGRTEDRLPLMAIVLPEKLKSAQPDVVINLKKNVDVLTTPFDIHTTLLDIVDLQEDANDYIVPGADYTRGLSLLDIIPKHRSCAEAGISPHWCACTKWGRMAKEDQMYFEVAHALANFVNSKTNHKRKECELMRLVSIAWVRQYYKQGFAHSGLLDDFSTKEIPNTGSNIYQTRILMTPGDTIYEGVVFVDRARNLLAISDKDVSRVNAHNNNTLCASNIHPKLDKYCYCKSNTTRN